MAQDDLIGEQLGGFTVVAPLGQGAMAKVYQARHERLNREVALKVIRRIPGEREDAARFQREKTVLEKLNHPHIMPIYDYAANSDYLWIASPLIRGGTLADRLGGGPLPLPQVVMAVKQLGGALDLAHQMGVIHRDIKPSNVLIEDEDGHDHLYLTDFGVAKLLEAEGLTAPGMTLGTPEYMSPEQVLGKTLDARSDQYALAVLAYHLVSGKVPFSGKMMEVMQQHAKASPPSLGKTVPPEFERTLFRALSKDPNKRYASATEFALALEQAAGSAPPAVSAPPITTPRGAPSPGAFLDNARTVAVGVIGDAPLSSPPPQLPAPSHRTSRRPVLIAAVILALLAAGAWGWWRGRERALSTPTPSVTTPPTHAPTPARTAKPKPRS